MDPKVASELSLRLPHLGLRMAEHSRRALAFAERLQLVRARVRGAGAGLRRARGRRRARARPPPAPCTVRGRSQFGGARGVSVSSASPRLQRGQQARRKGGPAPLPRKQRAGGAPRPHQERRLRRARPGCAGGAGRRRGGVPGPAEPPAARAAAAPGQPRVRLWRPAHPGAPAAAPWLPASPCHAHRCLPDALCCSMLYSKRLCSCMQHFRAVCFPCAASCLLAMSACLLAAHWAPGPLPHKFAAVARAQLQHHALLADALFHARSTHMHASTGLATRCASAWGSMRAAERGRGRRRAGPGQPARGGALPGARAEQAWLWADRGVAGLRGDAAERVRRVHVQRAVAGRARRRRCAAALP